MSCNSKHQMDARLRRIANVLLLNAGFIDNIGLLNGKMGVAIFFFHYARYTNNEIYERYAGELIDEIYEDINHSTPVDFANGLTGIGWGIEYLVRNGFVEADTDEALEEIDNAIFRATMQSPVSIRNQSDLFGFGLFYLARLKDREHDDDNLQTLKKKQLLIYMMDECERLLTKETLFTISVPKLTLYQVNSLVWFIIQTRKLSLFPTKSDKLILYLADYVNLKMEKNSDPVDLSVFHALLDELMPLLSNDELLKKYEILRTSSVISCFENNNEEQLVYQYIKSGWSPLLYDGIHLPCIHSLYKNAFTIINDEENWVQRLNKLNPTNIGLDTGMAGLGMILWQEVRTENERMEKTTIYHAN
jgi:hypothetical protein